MTLYAFVIILNVVAFVAAQRAARASEQRLMERIDQAIGGVRIAGHPAAQRQVERPQRVNRQVQVD